MKKKTLGMSGWHEVYMEIILNIRLMSWLSGEKNKQKEKLA